MGCGVEIESCFIENARSFNSFQSENYLIRERINTINVLRNEATSYQAMDRIALHMAMHIARSHSLIKITFWPECGQGEW
jgi:hypothetical protein